MSLSEVEDTFISVKRVLFNKQVRDLSKIQTLRVIRDKCRGVYT